MTSVIVLFIDGFEVFNKLLWDLCKREIELAPFDPPPVPINDPAFTAYLLQWISSNSPFSLLAICLQKFGNEFLINQIFGSINDILTYAPYGIWLVAGCLILVILYSFYPISHQHEILVKRYEGLQILKRERRLKEAEQTTNKPKSSSSQTIDKDNYSSTTSANPPVDPLYHLAPDLRNAGHFSSFQYVISHLLNHVGIFFITCLLVALIVLGIMIEKQGFQNVIPWIIASLNKEIFVIVRTGLPLLLDYVLLPVLTLLNIDPAVVFSPFRVVYIFFAGFFKYSDGPFVFSPRIMMFIDTILSLTVGLAFGVVGAVLRIGVSLFWGLFRTVIVWEPVVPVAFASLDMTYSAYASMMKAAHIEMCDIEELGQDLPPITKAGAYETTSSAVIMKADVYGSSVHDVSESEAAPLVVAE